MRRIFTFNQFNISESSAAGNMGQTYTIPFAYTSNDPKDGYSSKSFSDDLEALFVEKPNLRKEILEFLSLNLGITKIEELATMLEAGELEASDLSDDLIDAVIDYQFNL